MAKAIKVTAAVDWFQLVEAVRFATADTYEYHKQFALWQAEIFERAAKEIRTTCDKSEK